MGNIAQAQHEVPFKKGVNLTSWFQVSSARQIHFSSFTRQDIERIKSLGCDVIRLPINLHFMTNGEPDYTLDPLFLNFLDQVVTWTEELEIHLILDNHTFDPAVNTSPDVGDVLVKVWTQMAEHYKDRSEYLYYEVLNEPHGIGDSQWSAIQQTVIDAIRSIDNKHYIIVGGANWNSYNNLDELPVYTDSKLIYTFHFYDPFIFTHQGASWTDPSMASLTGIPFPFNAAAIPAVPDELKGTWLEGAVGNYHNEGTVARVKDLIDIAVAFRDQRNVPIFCGEFGVYIPNSVNSHRVAWYKTVKDYFEEKDIPWTMWDYTGGFGLFEKGSNELFDYDLNVPLLEALALNVPPQQEFTKKPATKGFVLYDDYMGPGMVNSSFGTNAQLDLYNENSPDGGDYCISWTESDQYGTIGFDFKPDLDLSLLRENDHVLRLRVRSSAAVTFDVRLIDTKASAGDRPWRMGKTVEGLTADMTWQTIEIPLKDLEEKGAWDDEWFNPEGKFDWTSVDRFEIVAEHHDLKGIELGFDNIVVDGEDIIVEEPEPEPEPEPVTAVDSEVNVLNVLISPNPMRNNVQVDFTALKSGTVGMSVLSFNGKEIYHSTFEVNAGHNQWLWDGRDKYGNEISPGIYLVRINNGTKTSTRKVVKLMR